MSDGETYKRRAQDVRRSARLNLIELRQARIAKRRGGAAVVNEGVPVRPQPQENTTEIQVTTTPAKKRKRTAKPKSKVKISPTETDAAQTDADLSDDLNEVAVKNAAMAEISDDPTAADATALTQDTVRADDPSQPPSPQESAHEEDSVAALTETELVEGGAQAAEAQTEAEAKAELAEEEPFGSPSENTPKTAPETPPRLEASELAKLPGAGSGLIWMLNECDITTMADLAQSDAQTLSGKLGLVGQILNIQTWIDFAQEQGADHGAPSQI